MKTILLSYEDRTKALEDIMQGALSFGFVISKYTKIFDTQKEAKETIKSHPCKPKKTKYLVLNKKQIKALEYLRERGKGYFNITDFLNLQ